MLTEKQIHYFNTFGFVILRQVFTQDELQTINAEYKHRLETAYQHAPFDGTQRHWVPMLESDTPFFANLLEDPRFYEVAEQLYGKDVFAGVEIPGSYLRVRCRPFADASQQRRSQHSGWQHSRY